MKNRRKTKNTNQACFMEAIFYKIRLVMMRTVMKD